MTKKKLAVSIAAVALAVATIFTGSNLPSVKAADVADKTVIELGVDGDYQEKKLTTADTQAIANQMGYGYFGGNVVVCGSNTTAYVDWENSSIPYWKAYDSFVLVPVLSRDDNGNLVIEKNEDGSLKTKINGALGWKGSKSRPGIVYDSTSEFGKVTGKGFNILPKEYWSEDSNSGCINQNTGSREIGYDGAKADDVYIVRVYYTADDLGNLQVARGLDNFEEGDNTDTYGDSLSGDEWSKYYTLENRKCSYVDFWILPDGVSTVLNFEDETPAPSPSEDSYTVDLGDSQIVSADTFASILAENATKDVVIKSNNDVTFTFAKGTMASVDGKTEYDFSTSIVNAYADTMPSYITKDNFVSQINFNYSGKLPATADIRFYAGTEYAGQTLYYSLMNADKTFAEVQAVVVDADGYMTVKQDHCSSYVVTKTEPKLPSNDDTKTGDGNASASDNNTSSGNTTVSTDKNSSSANTTATSPKTGDMTPIAIYVVMAVAAMGVIVFVKKRKTA
jgi:LPXTG-motif cell wall-anchored protein